MSERVEASVADDPFWLMSKDRIKRGRLEALVGLVRAHWPAARAAGLATASEPVIFVADGGEDGPSIIEFFEWTSPEALDKAHEAPAIQEIWGKMRPLFDTDGGGSP